MPSESLVGPTGLRSPVHWGSVCSGLLAVVAAAAAAAAAEVAVPALVPLLHSGVDQTPGVMMRAVGWPGLAVALPQVQRHSRSTPVPAAGELAVAGKGVKEVPPHQWEACREHCVAHSQWDRSWVGIRGGCHGNLEPWLHPLEALRMPTHIQRHHWS